MNRNIPSAPLRRRLMAVVYDAIAAFTVAYFAAFIPVVVGGSVIIPGNPLFSCYILAVVFGYFGVCWRRGRTLGMQAWKLEIVSTRADRPLTWREALVRFGGASISMLLCGAGYLAAVLDPQGRTWHDRWSHSRIVYKAISAGAGA